MNAEVSEVWDDITGSKDKPEKSLVILPKKSEVRHESEEITSLRRAKSLEAIFAVVPDAQILEDGLLVRAEILGKKFDFWPASDCYFIWSTQKYGSGIESLCEKILKFKLAQERKGSLGPV